MSIRNAFVRPLAVAGLIFTLGIAAFADTIRLKNGGIVKGRIVGFSNGKFVVAVGEGQRRRELTIAAADVETVIFDSPQTQPQQTVARNTNPQPRPQPQVTTPPAEDEDEEIIVVDDERTASTPPVTTPSRQPARPAGQPVELSVKVLADNTANGWTNSGWIVKKGQRIRISGEGEVSLGNGQQSTPAGRVDLDDPQKLVDYAATGALIAVIGDDNNDFIYVGAEREFTAARDGALFLGVNEGNLNDNSGAYQVKVEITPDS